jgi:hypothetical protein
LPYLRVLHMLKTTKNQYFYNRWFKIAKDINVGFAVSTNKRISDYYSVNGHQSF